VIRLANLDRAFQAGPTTTYVLRRIDLTIQAGEFVTIMGPSGAGKSTLLGILGMLDHAWTGEFHFLGEPVHTLPPRKRVELNKRYIGFVFQKYHLLDDLTVYENLEIPLSYRDVKPKERAAIVGETLDRFQMVGKKDLYPSQLSGGQQQLVGVARAVIAQPKLLLADEPTGNLHSAQGEEIMELFTRLNRQGTTIVQVTHSERNASYGHRTIQLRDGWIVEPETEDGEAGVLVGLGDGVDRRGDELRFGRWERGDGPQRIADGARVVDLVDRPEGEQAAQAGVIEAGGVGGRGDVVAWFGAVASRRPRAEEVAAVEHRDRERTC